MAYREYLKKQYSFLKDKDGGYVFTGDDILQEDTVNSEGRKLKSDERRKIHADLLPQPIVGDLEHGKIFICSLNPGFSDDDYDDEAKIRDLLFAQLKQENATMFWLKKELEGTGGGKWWQRRFDQGDQSRSMVNNIRLAYAQNGIIIGKHDVFDMLSRVVVALELFPYHSKEMQWGALEQKSVEEMRSFVHKELIPNAKVKNQIVCFTRAISKWGVTEEERAKYSKCVFCVSPEKSRRITFNVKLPLGAFIWKHLNHISNSFTKLL